jgi:hypothetical protein
VNLIFVGAYWVKDVLWLRLLSIVGSLMIIPYYLLQTKPLWTPTMWSCVFISIHATRAWGIMKERRPVALTADEQLLYDKTFSARPPQQFKRLRAIDEWQDLDRGYVLHSTGDPPDSLEAVVRGELEARRRGRVLGHARPGDLAGLASVLGGSRYCLRDRDRRTDRGKNPRRDRTDSIRGCLVQQVPRQTGLRLSQA